jgi:peroxiredoxin
MPAINSGKKAPDFKLPATDGKPYSLKEVLAKNVTLVVFYKDTCPTCQFALPFIGRIYQAYKDKGLQVLGIEQDDKQRTVAFSQEYGLTFPALLDMENYKVSYAYGIDTVPTIFLVDKNGEILFTSVGFVKDELAELSKKIAEKLGVKNFEVFKPGENVPALKAG